jgi:ribulose-5-phosphate 4-epimerase/fuculose-1-phosphate aldolase
LDLQIAYDELHDFGRVCVERGLVVGRAGNISARVNQDEVLISKRRSRLERLVPQDLVVCSLGTGEYQGEVEPSTETPMHRAVYLNQPQAQAILHSSAFYTTLVACADVDLRLDLVPESMAYLSNMGRVPYYHPGSPELAQAAGEQAGHNVIILDNHGLIVWGKSIDEAVMVTEMMERHCQTLVVAMMTGGALNLRWLGEEVMQDFRDRVIYRKK